MAFYGGRSAGMFSDGMVRTPPMYRLFDQDMVRGAPRGVTAPNLVQDKFGAWKPAPADTGMARHMSTVPGATGGMFAQSGDPTRVWTGSAWDTAPTFDAADFGDYKREMMGSNADSGITYQDMWGRVRGAGFDQYGAPITGQGWNNMSMENSNYQIRDVAPDRSSFDVLLKSAAKEGTRIRYVLQNGQYVPQGVIGVEKWNTNPTTDNLGMATVAAAALAGSAMGAYGGTGAATEGLGAIPGATVEGLWPGAMNFGPGYLPGLEGAGLIGSGGATAGGGMLGGLDSGGYVPDYGGYAPGENPVGQIDVPQYNRPSPWDNLRRTLGDETINRLPGQIINSLLGDQERRRAASASGALVGNTLAAAEDYRRAYGDYATGLAGMLPEMTDAYQYRPATVNNGYATSVIDPATGQVRYDLNAPYAAMRNDYIARANEGMARIGTTDPRAHAAERYGAAQALLAPARQREEQGLLQSLYNKGGYGLSLNTPTPSGTAAVNPYVGAFQTAREQQNAQMAYDSLAQGESYLDNLIRRQRGMLDNAMTIENAGQGVLRDAGVWGDTFTNNRRNMADMRYRIGERVLDSNRRGVTDYLDRIMNARNEHTGRQAAADSGRRDQWGNIISGVVGNLPWGRWLGGLFGG